MTKILISPLDFERQFGSFGLHFLSGVWCRGEENVRSFLALIMLCALAATAQGQDRHDWRSLSRLQVGDRVRVHFKTGPVTATFQSWTPQEVTVGTVTAKREDVLKIERYRHGGSRAKHIGFGALIGFSGGFAIGASVAGCRGGLGPCITRPEGGAVVGGAGAVIGALIGAILPAHSKEVIYSSR
jgi:hypothetical protein